jgi:hypothetical protein
MHELLIAEWCAELRIPEFETRYLIELSFGRERESKPRIA